MESAGKEVARNVGVCMGPLSTPALPRGMVVFESPLRIRVARPSVAGSGESVAWAAERV